MRYLGGKSVLFKKFASIVLNGWGRDYKCYVEPFVGGANSMQYVPVLPGCRRIGYDVNPFVIALHRAGQNFRDFRFVSREEYAFLRTISRLPEEERRFYGIQDWEIGMAGFLFSYRGAFFQGYNGDSVNSSGSRLETNAETLIHSFENTVLNCLDVHFETKRFEILELPDEPCIVYCDPPYIGTREYDYDKAVLKERIQMDVGWYEQFWDKVKRWTLDGHAVYVSEYTAPDNFFPVWEGIRKSNMDAGAKRGQTERRNRYEKLFIYG